MQAIQTRYYGPTNSRGARIVAKAQAGRVTMPYRHELNFEENHTAAARKLIEKMGWNGPHYGDYVSGQLPCGDFVHVADDKRLQALKGFVNSYRAATWSGNPWSHPEFRDCVDAIGRSYGYYGNTLGAPTTDDEAANLKG